MRLSQSLVLPALLVLIGYVLVLTIVPVLFAPDPAAPNAAAVLGYNIKAAYWGVLGWTLVGGVLALIAVPRGWFDSPVSAVAEETPPAPRKARWTEAVVVFAVAVLAHWPTFLARYGPYSEDGYFLSTLARMQCGQRPFADFEFIYGPVMIAPAHAWMQTFGYSMTSYYALYALLQGALFAALLLALQRYIANPGRRLVVFLALAALIVDGLLGLNWIGWRRMLSLFALFLVAARPHDVRAAALAGVILAVHLTYSLEYGAAGLAGCGAIYLLILFGGSRQRTTVSCGLTTLAVAMVGALLLAAATTSGDIGTYVSATLTVLREANDTGLGGFKFYWTAHSLALFGLLSLAIMAIAVGLRNATSTSEGDRLLIGSVVFAMVALKAAFQRADVWHMGAPFLPLAFVLLARAPMTMFRIDGNVQRAVGTLVCVAAIANLIGVFPMAAGQAKGLARGAFDWARGVPHSGPIQARSYSVQSERSQPDENIVALASFLATPELRYRPVLLYGRMWLLNAQIGVCPAGYLNYEWMYGEERHPVARLVAASPDLLVVLTERSYSSIQTGTTKAFVPAEPGWGRRLASWTSTVHYQQSPIEWEIKDRLWLTKIGRSLGRTHSEIARFGPYVVLARR